MGRAAWRDYVEPGELPSIADRDEPEPDVPHAIGVIFGSQVGWAPDREQSPLLACDLVTGEIILVCYACGGDHGPIRPGSRLYCAACHRSGFDVEATKILADHPPPRPDRKPTARPKPTIEVPERYRHRLPRKD